MVRCAQVLANELKDMCRKHNPVSRHRRIDHGMGAVEMDTGFGSMVVPQASSDVLMRMTELAGFRVAHNGPASSPCVPCALLRLHVGWMKRWLIGPRVIVANGLPPEGTDITAHRGQNSCRRTSRPRCSKSTRIRRTTRGCRPSSTSTPRCAVSESLLPAGCKGSLHPPAWCKSLSAAGPRPIPA